MAEGSKTLLLVGDSGVVSTILSMAAGIAPLMMDQGIAMPSPVILQTGDAELAEALKGHFQVLGAAVGTAVCMVRNDQCIVMLVSRNCKNSILHILGRDFPSLVFIAAGVVPSFLPDDYVLQLEDRISKPEAKVLAAEVGSFKAYAQQNPGIVVRDLEIFKSSNWYAENLFASPLTILFHATLAVYRSYHRGRHSEAETDTWLGILQDAIERCIRQAEGQGFDILQPIRRLVTTYIKEHSRIVIRDIESVDGQVEKALACDQAILFDYACYYFPEKLFRLMCGPLLDGVSILEIKARLLNEGVLHCNRESIHNFTVKRQFMTADGRMLRLRFLKISRSFIVEDGTLALEELGGG